MNNRVINDIILIILWIFCLILNLLDGSVSIISYVVAIAEIVVLLLIDIKNNWNKKRY